MDSLSIVILVFLSGVAELWLAVPLGFALKLPPHITALISALGAISAVLAVAFSGDNLRRRFLKWRYGSEKALNEGHMYHIWNKYGIIGLGLLSPLLFGAPLGTTMGIILGAKRNHLILWMAVGIIIWSIGLTGAVFLGLLSVKSLV